MHVERTLTNINTILHYICVAHLVYTNTHKYNFRSHLCSMLSVHLHTYIQFYIIIL
jgi:hypothetical protein